MSNPLSYPTNHRHARRPGVAPASGDGAAGSQWHAPLVLAGSPLVASRSLGDLLGLASLHFKVESCQPTGSWLDRSAAALVEAACSEGRAGLGVAGLHAWTVPLAVQCARAGLRLVVLAPGGQAAAADGAAVADGGAADPGWLAALGARVVAVAASPDDLSRVASSIMQAAGLWPVDTVAWWPELGLREIVQEIDSAGHGQSVLAVPSLTGHEPRELAAVAAEGWSGSLPLPLADLADSAGRERLRAVVGAVGADAATPVDSGPATPGVLADVVHTVAVTPREAEAARRLLAREEGLLVSRRGAAGFAALLRTLREDRSRRPRARLLQHPASTVAVLTGEPARSVDGPPIALDDVPARSVSLATLAESLERLLVEPPGR